MNALLSILSTLSSSTTCLSPKVHKCPVCFTIYTSLSDKKTDLNCTITQPRRPLRE